MSMPILNCLHEVPLMRRRQRLPEGALASNPIKGRAIECEIPQSMQA